MLKTILLAEESNFFRNFVKSKLANTPYRVAAEAVNGHTAVLEYQQCQPDIVLLDNTMEFFNGLYALRQILHMNPEAKIIMCSAIGKKQLMDQAKEFGAKYFIGKPHFEGLIPLLNRLTD
ncbi:response regulator [Falsibacillus pallidus]|uniref:Two-component system chemotaxis response regulator CheY n=1 Tax=Falsibacillus pallidus TaxID=493781 RepID=A0A370GC44_9BACI|nr:response regulator [Falsibacillus pallidus]RDI40024.1 two-component system chemotaxis response regulator CheY [Falsibacillus pallidus]